MIPKQRIVWHFPTPHLIRGSRNLLGTVQIFLIASLLLNSFGQEQIISVNKFKPFASILNTSTVQEPPQFHSNGTKVDLKNMTQVYLDSHIAGYVSEDVTLDIVWPFKKASKVWEYAKKTYGSYGHDPRIYVFLYVDTTTQDSTSLKNKYATRFEASYLKNIVKLGKQSKNAWTNVVNQTNELRNFASMVGHIVDNSTRNTIGSPSYNNDHEKTHRSSAWNFIFVYDVFLELEMRQEADLFLEADPSSPLTRNDLDIEESLDQDDRVNWIKNWFWPIYSKHGGAEAMRQFITNCYLYFPQTLLNRTDPEANSYYEYTKTMNKGEFVHFWSGSVGTDLRYLANFAFTWDLNDEKNFQSARKSFPMLNYRCNDNSCEKIPVLDHLVTGHLKTDKLRPAIFVISEEENSSKEKFRKRVKGTLYRPLNHTERYLYDGKNELFIFETPNRFCYYISCSAPYIIKWVTNISLMDTFDSGCRAGEYFNSRRMQDLPHTDEALKGKGQKTLKTTYTIQLLIPGIEYTNNMGLLKCESIQNATQATHIYLTNTKLGRDEYQYLPNNEVVELVSDLNLNKKIIVPCKGASLNMMPDLKVMGKESIDETKWKTFWDRQYRYINAESGIYNVTYNPAIGFTFSYEKWPFNGTNNAAKTIYFKCYLNNEIRNTFIVYVRSKEQEPTSKLTVVENQSEISSTARGCFLVKNVDRFLFVDKQNLFLNESPIKIIRCSTPDACDLFRQCLDTKDDFCYSVARRIQADNSKLNNLASQGLFRCLIDNKELGYKPVYEYTFVGLNNIRYVFSENIPKEAIIYLDETHRTLLTNVPAAFRCQIATFVLVPNIRFALVYSNKTVVLVGQGTVRLQNQSLPFLSSNIGIYDINDVSSLINANSEQGIAWENINLNLTADVVGIMCFAPLHNSTEWANATRSFVAKDIKIPKIKKNSKIFRRIFEKDEQHFNLNCESNGVPDPEIKWILPNTCLAVEDKIKIENSYLKFSRMEESFAGKYTCVASNLYGNDSYEFLLEHQESGLGWQEKTGIGFAVACFTIVVCLIVCLLFKYRNSSRQLRDLTEDEIKEFTDGKKGKVQPKGNIDISLLPFDKKYILNPIDLMIEKGVVLGSGHFGVVHRGLLNGCPVAVKTLRSTADVLSVKSLLGELKIMSFIGDHDNVIHFFGAVIEKIQKRAVEAVVELSPFGDLKKYLRNIFDSISTAESKFINILVDDDVSLAQASTRTVQLPTNKISTLTLIDWCRQIASGMHFLASKRVYHGDLAARNVLVFENNTVKITDFGMSKQLYYSASYVKEAKIALPWRWMAIETLRFQEFSIESDVWAFGVTMWEIFSLGRFPFPGLNWTPDIVTILSTGMRMAKPEYCTKSLYDLMLKCWCEKPIDRPKFSQLVEILERILEEQQSSFITGYVNEQNVGANEIVYLVLDEDLHSTTPTESLSVT